MAEKMTGKMTGKTTGKSAKPKTFHMASALPSARLTQTADKAFWLALLVAGLVKAWAHSVLWGGFEGALTSYYHFGSHLWERAVVANWETFRARPLGFLFDVYVTSRFVKSGWVVVVLAVVLLWLTALMLARALENAGFRFGAPGAVIVALSASGWLSVFHAANASYVVGVFFAVSSAYCLSGFAYRLNKGGKGINIRLTAFFLTNLAAMFFGLPNAALTITLSAVFIAAHYKTLPSYAKIYAIAAVSLSAVIALVYYRSSGDLIVSGNPLPAVWGIFTQSFRVIGTAGLYDGSAWAVSIIVPLCGLLFFGLASKKLFVWHSFGVATRGEMKEIGRRFALGLAVSAVPLLSTAFDAGSTVFGLPEMFKTGLALYGIETLVAAQIGLAVMFDAATDAASLITFKVGKRTADLWLFKPLAAATMVLICFFAFS